MAIQQRPNEIVVSATNLAFGAELVGQIIERHRDTLIKETGCTTLSVSTWNDYPHRYFVRFVFRNARKARKARGTRICRRAFIAMGGEFINPLQLASSALLPEEITYVVPEVETSIENSLT